MARTCLACGQRPAATVPEFPALCGPCLNRAGLPVCAGDRVVCTVSEGCSGTVDRLEDDGLLVVVRTADGGEAWVPVQEIVGVVG